MIRTMQTARKQHRCALGCGNPIAAGTRYERVVYPPWTLIREDPEDRPTKLDGWAVQKFHIQCGYPY